MELTKEQMFDENKINPYIDFIHNKEEYAGEEYQSLEKYKEHYDLSGNIYFSNFGSYDGDLSFFCGPECFSRGKSYLSDSCSINETLKYLMNGSEYENCMDFGAAENFHIISDFYNTLPEGKTLEDAFNYLKEKLMSFDNVNYYKESPG